MKRHLERLQQLEEGYQPSSEVVSKIEDKTLLAFIGGFAVGKTTLMHAVAEHDSRFSEVISFTTRPPRDDSDNYRFISNLADDVEQILDRAENGELVNFTVHPTTGYIYGTETDDYRTEFCMLATTSSNFRSSTSQLPFHRTEPIVVVAEPSVWLDRISKRSTTLAEQGKRIDEARQSLEWSLDSESLFVDNSSKNVANTAGQFVADLMSGDTRGVRRSRRIAEKMLSVISSQD